MLVLIKTNKQKKNNLHENLRFRGSPTRAFSSKTNGSTRSARANPVVRPKFAKKKRKCEQLISHRLAQSQTRFKAGLQELDPTGLICNRGSVCEHFY